MNIPKTTLFIVALTLVGLGGVVHAGSDDAPVEAPKSAKKSAPELDPGTMRRGEIFEYSMRDSVHAKKMLSARRAAVVKLDEVSRQDALGAAQLLIDNCAYTRIGVQALATIRIAMAPHWSRGEDDPLRAIDPEMIRRLDAIKAGVDAQWALLGDLGVADFKAPRAGTHLAGDEHALSLSALQGAEDPLALTEAAMGQVLFTVGDMSVETAGAVMEGRERLEAHTQGEWPPKAALMGYQEDLRAIMKGAEAHLKDCGATTCSSGTSERLEALHIQAERLDKLIANFVALYC